MVNYISIHEIHKTVDTSTITSSQTFKNTKKIWSLFELRKVTFFSKLWQVCLSWEYFEPSVVFTCWQHQFGKKNIWNRISQIVHSKCAEHGFTAEFKRNIQNTNQQDQGGKWCNLSRFHPSWLCRFCEKLRICKNFTYHFCHFHQSRPNSR